MPKKPTLAILQNELRKAERDWQRHAAYDEWRGGNPWASLRDEAAARFVAIEAQISNYARS